MLLRGRLEMHAVEEAQAQDGNAALPLRGTAGQDRRKAAVLLDEVMFVNSHHDVSIIMSASYQAGLP